MDTDKPDLLVGSAAPRETSSAASADDAGLVIAADHIRAAVATVQREAAVIFGGDAQPQEETPLSPPVNGGRQDTRQGRRDAPRAGTRPAPTEEIPPNPPLSKGGIEANGLPTAVVALLSYEPVDGCLLPGCVRQSKFGCLKRQAHPIYPRYRAVDYSCDKTVNFKFLPCVRCSLWLRDKDYRTAMRLVRKGGLPRPVPLGSGCGPPGTQA